MITDLNVDVVQSIQGLHEGMLMKLSNSRSVFEKKGIISLDIRCCLSLGALGIKS